MEYIYNIYNKCNSFTDYNKTEGSKKKHCDFNQKHNPEDVCVVDENQFGPCTSANSYGYKQGKPCIFLKLNKIYGWVPQVYDAALPNMPQDLQQVINNTSVEEVSWNYITNFWQPNAFYFTASENLGFLQRTLRQG